MPATSLQRALPMVLRAAIALPVVTSVFATGVDAQSTTPAQARDPRGFVVAPTVNYASRAIAVRYGDSASLGNGRVRAYVTLDKKTKAPLEIGVAFSEAAMDGLPTDGAGHHGQTGAVHEWSLALPKLAAAPFTFVDVNWNPMGHEPDGVYQDVPHFDFHFYTVDKATRDGIVPSNPLYAERANRLPSAEFVPPFTVQLGPPGAKPVDVAVPKMGVHWVDVRSPELQKLFGKPDAWKPFTSTFILGSWDGRFHFWEPMITRAHILAKKSATDAAVRDELIPISLPTKYNTAGVYPTAYRISYDAEAREYRVALANLVQSK